MKNIRIYRERDREQVLALWQECDLIHPKNDPQKDLDRKKNLMIMMKISREEHVVFWTV